MEEQPAQAVGALSQALLSADGALSRFWVEIAVREQNSELG